MAKLRFGISMEKMGRTYNMMLHGMIPSRKLYMRISLNESMKESRKPSMKSAMIRWLMMK